MEERQTVRAMLAPKKIIKDITEEEQTIPGQ